MGPGREKRAKKINYKEFLFEYCKFLSILKGRDLFYWLTFTTK